MVITRDEIEVSLDESKNAIPSYEITLGEPLSMFRVVITMSKISGFFNVNVSQILYEIEDIDPSLIYFASNGYADCGSFEFNCYDSMFDFLNDLVKPIAPNITFA